MRTKCLEADKGGGGKEKGRFFALEWDGKGGTALPEKEKRIPGAKKDA